MDNRHRIVSAHDSSPNSTTIAGDYLVLWLLGLSPCSQNIFRGTRTVSLARSAPVCIFANSLLTLKIVGKRLAGMRPSALSPITETLVYNVLQMHVASLPGIKDFVLTRLLLVPMFLASRHCAPLLSFQVLLLILSLHSLVHYLIHLYCRLNLHHTYTHLFVKSYCLCRWLLKDCKSLHFHAKKGLHLYPAQQCTHHPQRPAPKYHVIGCRARYHAKTLSFQWTNRDSHYC